MKYAKIVKYNEDNNHLYKRYIGIKTMGDRCSIPDSSSYIFKEYDDIAVFAGEFESEEQCTLRWLKPLGISKSTGKILGFRIISDDLSSLKEGQIVRVIRKGGPKGGSILIPYDSRFQFEEDVELLELEDNDKLYQEFLDIAATKMSERFKCDLLISREAFLKEKKEYGDTIHKILTDEEIDFEVEGMKEKISVLGLRGVSGDGKFVYRNYLRKGSKIFDNLSTPIMGMYPRLNEYDSVLLSGTFHLTTGVNFADDMVYLNEDGKIILKNEEQEEKGPQRKHTNKKAGN